MGDDSLAIGQRSLGDPEVRYPLMPPLTAGCPKTSTEDLAYPVEVDYDYGRVPADFLSRYSGGGGLEHWSELMPPLLAPGLVEGGTPLVEIGGGVFVKDESRNPTWSHKDRLNRCAVSAAVAAGAGGVVAASSGNHGASAAAYAARAGLRSIVLLSENVPPAVLSFVRAYGAAVLTVSKHTRWPVMSQIVERLGYHPVSNLTVTHTGHPFGPEGYKSIAYEIVAELGVPAAVFVPTGYGELLFGVWKGFDELRRLGITSTVPPLYSCEPSAGGPLARAMTRRLAATSVEAGHTDAYAIGCSVSSYRGVLALTGSGGTALLVSDAEMAAAQRELARLGQWFELSGAAGVAGLRQIGNAGRQAGDAGRQVGYAGFDGPVVCIATSSGFKDISVGTEEHKPVDPDWGEVIRALRQAGVRA